MAIDLNLTRAEQASRQFAVGKVAEVVEFTFKGNINQDAYLVSADGKRYLLQRLNTDVFTRPERVTAALKTWTNAQTVGLEGAHWAGPYEALRLVPTHSNEPTWDSEGQVWRLLPFIEGTISYKSLADAGDRTKQLELAEETGRGMGISTRLVSHLESGELRPSLLGYRDTSGYLAQFDAVVGGAVNLEQASAHLPGDAELADATSNLFFLSHSPAELEARSNDLQVKRLIDLVQAHRDWAVGMQKAVQEGKLRRTVIHGDTKIENFLFCNQTGRVKSVVDLDTVMSYTWLADWGDLARSLVNVAGEKETDLDKVRVDEEVYEALTRGFLSIEGVAPAEET
ncbi:MAG: phosphotransferase, partial [Armatimonadota bacterium]